MQDRLEPPARLAGSKPARDHGASEMRLVIYGEERLYSEAMALLFERSNHHVVASVSNLEALEEVIATAAFDCSLVSIQSDVDAAMRAISMLRQGSPSAAIVALSANADRQAMERAIDTGADGVCLTADGVEEIENILQRCVRSRSFPQVAHQAAWSNRARGVGPRRDRQDLGPKVTPREQRVLDELIRGSSTSNIAGQLHVSEATVRTHLQHLFTKFGVHSRLGLVATAVRSERVRVQDAVTWSDREKLSETVSST